MTAWANSASSLDYQTTSQGPVLCKAETNTLSGTHQGTRVGYFEAQYNNRGYFYLLETSQGGLSVNIS